MVDINPQRHGKYIIGSGQEVVAPEFLKEYKPDLVVAMNNAYVDGSGATSMRWVWKRS